MRSMLVVGAALAFAPAAVAGVPNPCTLLTNAEVGKVLGGAISDRSASGNRLYRGCEWTGPNQGGFFQTRPKLTVQLSRETKGQFEQGARRTKNAVRVDSLGQSAFAVQQAGGFLYVWEKGYTLFVTVSLGADAIPAEKAVAKVIVRRL